MFKYVWVINKLHVAEDNLVVKVDWRVTAIDEENNLSASASGIRELVCGDTFVPYEQLTEQQVLDWCFAPEVITWTEINGVERSITKNLQTEGEAQVAGQIARQLAQKAAEPALPWA
jgi:hypothetical protein